MRKNYATLILVCFIAIGVAQQKPEAIDYIARYKDIAIAEMVKTKIPASIILAQGMHESGCGNSSLAQKGNNHFGIKCKNEWTGKTMYKDDDAPNECFRVYEKAADSYADHSAFLISHPRYAPLFQLPITDYKDWAYGLKSAGYATNPRYPEILIQAIELYHLEQYDRIGVAMLQGNDAPMVATRTAQSDSSADGVAKPGERKEYTINGLKALKAIGAEDPLKVALNYDIDYQRILSFNDLSEGEHFKDGEYIFLEAKKGHASTENYTVQRGESMHDISQKFGIKLRELYVKNEMKYTENEQLYAGEKVYLKGKRQGAPHIMSYASFLKTCDESKNKVAMSTPPPAKAIAEPTGINQYRVQPNDTLYSIAHKFNLSVAQLRAMNNLPGSNIHPGQSLMVK